MRMTRRTSSVPNKAFNFPLSNCLLAVYSYIVVKIETHIYVSVHAAFARIIKVAGGGNVGSDS